MLENRPMRHAGVHPAVCQGEDVSNKAIPALKVPHRSQARKKKSHPIFRLHPFYTGKAPGQSVRIRRRRRYR